MGYPRLSQRPIPPAWGLCLALLVVSVILDPSHNPTWLLASSLIPIVFAVLLVQQTRIQEAIMAPEALAFLHQQTMMPSSGG